MNGWRYLSKRLFSIIPIILGLTLLSFLLGVIAPGDPAAEVLNQAGLQEPTRAEIEAMREQLGLNDPLYVQYFRWLLQAIQGDLGTSYMTGQSVWMELVHRLPITVTLSFWAIFITIMMGIPLGLYMAIKPYGLFDRLSSIFALFLISIPGFWLAILLIYIFSEHYRLLPTSGWGTWQQLIMPAIVLASGATGIVMRLTRASVLEVLPQQYILTARSKGLWPWLIYHRHALRNALIPVVTFLGTFFGGVLGGSVIVEVIFSIPGMGRFAIEGIFRRDYPVIQGYVLIVGLVYVSFNLLVDFLYVLLNPQIRLGGTWK